MTLLFHIAERAAWDHARRALSYAPPSLADEGFIHLSSAAQLLGTLDRFYADAEDLSLLLLDDDALGPALKWDDLEHDDGSTATFPHLYRALRPLEVVQSLDARDADELEDAVHVLFAHLGLEGHRWIGADAVVSRLGADAVAAFEADVFGGLRASGAWLSPYGSFKVKVRRARGAVDPRNGGIMTLPEVRTATFKQGRELRDAAEAGSALPEGPHHALWSLVADERADHTWVELPTLGTFRWEHRRERVGRNPATGAKIVIPAVWTLTFRASDELKAGIAPA